MYAGGLVIVAGDKRERKWKQALYSIRSVNGESLAYMRKFSEVMHILCRICSLF